MVRVKPLVITNYIIYSKQIKDQNNLRTKPVLISFVKSKFTMNKQRGKNMATKF